MEYTGHGAESGTDTEASGTAGTAGTGTSDATAVGRAAVPIHTLTGTAPTPGTGTGRHRRWYRRRDKRAAPGTDHTGTAGVASAADPVPTDRYQYSPAGTEAAIRSHLRDVPVPTAGSGTGTGRRSRKSAAGTTDAAVPGLFGRIVAAIGAMFEIAPLAAPLLASGWFTFLVVTDEFGLNQPWPIAVIMVLGLEGVVWTLAKLYEMRLVAGHSTIADRLGIMAVVGAIGSLIYWHSMIEAKARTAEARAAAVLAGIDPETIRAATADWRGAAVAASMSALGVFVYGRKARWNRRVELEAEGRVDMQALRIGLWQWIVSPWESVWSFRHGMKYRIKRPTDAVRDWRLWKQEGKPKLWPPAMTVGTAGTGTDEVVQVPAWMIAELMGNAVGTTGTGGTGFAGYLSPTSPGPGGTTGGTGTGTGTGYLPVLGAGTTPALTGTASAGTAGTGTSGTGGDSETIARYRARNAKRLERIRAVLDGTDGRPDWRTIPERDLSLSMITEAGGFSNRTDAGQCKSVLLADRRNG